MSSPVSHQRSGPRSDEQAWRHGPGVVASLWRYRIVVGALTVVGALAGYGLSLLQAPTYEASARLFLADPRNSDVFSGDIGEAIDSENYAQQQVQLLTSRAVLEQAAGNLDNGPDASGLASRITAEVAMAGGFVVEVHATAGSAEGAAALANAVTEGYQQVVARTEAARAAAAAAQLEPSRQAYEIQVAALQEQLAQAPGNGVLENQIQQVSAQLLQLESRAQELLVNAAAFGSGVELAEEAVAPEAASGPAPLRNAVGLGLVAGGLGGAFAYWRAGRTRVTTTRADPAQILGAPLLGEIPDYRSPGSGTLAGQLALEPATAEAYQFVLASIEFALEQVGGSSLLVTSAAPGDGKTTTALQLAMAASRDGRRVVLLDADIRAKGLTRMLGLAERTGLTELALQHLDVDDSVHYLPVSPGLLPVVAAGGGVDDAGGFFRTPQFRKAVQRIKDEAELVMVDSSPLLAVADTTVIASQVGGLVLVVDHRTQLAQLEQIRERLAFISTPLLGYVYNRSDSPTLSAYEYGSGRSGADSNSWLAVGVKENEKYKSPSTES